MIDFIAILPYGNLASSFKDKFGTVPLAEHSVPRGELNYGFISCIGWCENMRALTIPMATVILAVLILFVQHYQAFAQTVIPLETKALDYIKNVLPFNMSYYNITVGNAYPLPSGPNDPTITQAVDIDLKSDSSAIHVVCLYVNGALHQCGVRPTGTPVADRTYTSLEAVATRILLAHQQQTGLDSTSLVNTLNLVKDNEATNVNLDNVNLIISKFPDIIGSQNVNGLPVPIGSNSSFSISFHWMLTESGILTGQVILSFDHNGVLYNLQDERAMNPTGNTTIIDGEQETNPTPASITANQENLTSLKAQASNYTSTQSNQLITQKTADSQNMLIVPILVAAVAAYVTVVLLIITYKCKNQVNKI